MRVTGPAHLQVATAAHVTTVTLDRPEVLNALNASMMSDLRALLEELEHDDATRVVILTGAGRGFCSGADLADIASAAGDDHGPAALRQRMRAGSVRLARTLAEFDKPLIAAVNGPCAGAGAGIVLACDFALAAPGATFAFTFVQRGLVPDYATTFWLPRLVGLREARRLCLLGDRVTAEEAAHVGLVDSVVPAETLLEAAHALGRRLADGAGVALRLTKRLLLDSFDLDQATALDREFTAQAICFSSADAAEGARAFLEKRPATFGWH